MCVGSGSEVPLVFLIISGLHQGLGQQAGSLHLPPWTNLAIVLMVMGRSTEEHQHPLDPSISFLAGLGESPRGEGSCGSLGT